MNPTVTLIYIYPVGHDEHDGYAKRFVQSYLKFQAGYPHETMVVCNGGAPNDFIRGLFRNIPCKFFQHDDSGWDIGAYLAVVRAIKTEAVFCCGGLTHFKRFGWLKKLVDAWNKFGAGLYGSLGSYQYGIPHLVTTGFLCPTHLVSSYPGKVVTYEDRAEFEHGVKSLTNLALCLCMPAKLVTWCGVHSLDELWNPENVLNKGDQSNCLTYYKQTDIYEVAPLPNKKVMQLRVTGKAK